MEYGVQILPIGLPDAWEEVYSEVNPSGMNNSISRNKSMTRAEPLQSTKASFMNVCHWISAHNLSRVVALCVNRGRLDHIRIRN